MMDFDLAFDSYIKDYNKFSTARLNKEIEKEIKMANINKIIELALNDSTNTTDELSVQWKVDSAFDKVRLTNVLSIQAIEQNMRTGECSSVHIRLEIEDDINNDDYLEFLVDDIKSKFMSYKMDLYNRILFGGIYDR